LGGPPDQLIRLTEIDETNIGDHARLAGEDGCLYLFEYTSGKNYAFSATNSLISNLKKKPSISSENELYYKNRAINQCAANLRQALNPAWLDTATLVPVPPSKAVDHPDYDRRIERIARLIRPGLDVRLLVTQRESTVAAHEAQAGERVTVDQLLEFYEINETVAAPAPTSIGILDDVLTAGTHFKAMQHVLSARFPGVPIIGLFIARRVFPPDHVADAFDILLG
jgi:hypothetical protein